MLHLHRNSERIFGVSYELWINRRKHLLHASYASGNMDVTEQVNHAECNGTAAVAAQRTRKQQTDGIQAIGISTRSRDDLNVYGKKSLMNRTF